MTYNFETFVERHFNVSQKSGAEWMVHCIFHDNQRSASMQLNVDKGLFICFGCGMRGGIKTLERELGIRAQEDGIDVADIIARLDALKNPEAEVLPVLPESYLSRYRFPTDYWGPHRRSCKPDCKMHRGLDPATIAAFDLGYDPVGDLIGGYVTIPIRNVNGGLLGVIKRYLDPDVDLKYRYPKGFKRAKNLFGSWMVEQDDDAHTVALVEGSIDAMCTYQAGTPSLALYGSSINPSQVRLLRRLGVRRVILFFDNDKAGKKCIDTCKGWHEYRRSKDKTIQKRYNPMTDLRREFIVEVARYEYGGPSDPGSMSSEQITEALRKTRRLV